MGRVEAICLSKKKGEKKRPVASARFVADQGIEGDAHAGSSSHRQVSLLAAEEIETFKRPKLPDIKPGDFAENVIVSGLELSRLGLGSRLKLGAEAELSVTQIGKVCHTPCAIYRQMGDCIMPRLGLFARVMRGGAVAPGAAAEILSGIDRSLFQVVVLTISDRCSRGETVDTAGPAVSALLSKPWPRYPAGAPMDSGAHLYKTEIIPDEQPLIEKRLKHYCDGHSIDLVVTVGGTGFSPRDVTPEAVSEVAHRLVPGLGEAMRLASAAKTPHAMLSRAICAIRNSTLIVSLPGSERGAIENLEVILPALFHALAKLRGDPSDCQPRQRLPE